MENNKYIKKDILKKIFNYFLFAAMTSMVGLVFINAVLRYGFDTSLPVSEELARYFFIWISFLGAIVAFKEGKHVGVDLLVKRLKGKARLIIGIIADGLIVFAMVVVFIGGIEYMRIAATTISPATGIPFGYIAISVIVISTSFIGITIFKYITKLKSLHEGKE